MIFDILSVSTFFPRTMPVGIGYSLDFGGWGHRGNGVWGWLLYVQADLEASGLVGIFQDMSQERIRRCVTLD